MGIAPYSLVIWFMTDVLSHKGASHAERKTGEERHRYDRDEGEEATDKASDKMKEAARTWRQAEEAGEKVKEKGR